MKVAATREPTPPKFEPVTLTITLENADEAAALYAAFNWTGVCDVTRKFGLDDIAIRDALYGRVPTVAADSDRVHRQFRC